VEAGNVIDTAAALVLAKVAAVNVVKIVPMRDEHLVVGPDSGRPSFLAAP
jgi:hypothetical protein